MPTGAASQALCPKESYRLVEVEKEKLEVESVVNQRDRGLNELVVVGVSSSRTRTMHPVRIQSVINKDETHRTEDLGSPLLPSLLIHTITNI